MTESNLDIVMTLLSKLPSGIENQDDLNLVKGIGTRLFKAMHLFLWKDGVGVDQKEFDRDVDSLMILHSAIPDKFNVVRTSGEQNESSDH